MSELVPLIQSAIENANISALLFILFSTLFGISFLPRLQAGLFALAEMAAIDPTLDWGEKVWIFILFVLAGIFTLAAVLAIAPWVLIFTALAVFFTLLATLWSLIGFMIWPWEKRFWDNLLVNPWIAFFIGLFVGIPLIILLIALLAWLFPAIGLLLAFLMIPILIIFALWWLIFVQRCGWINWLVPKLKAIVTWFRDTLIYFYQIELTIRRAITKFITETRQEWRTIRKKRCTGWVWGTQWLCKGFTYFFETVLVVVEVIVKVVVWVISKIILGFWAVITIVVAIILYIIIYTLKLIFWCW